jgi:hypothetical protein
MLQRLVLQTVLADQSIVKAGVGIVDQDMLQLYRAWRLYPFEIKNRFDIVRNWCHE